MFQLLEALLMQKYNITLTQFMYPGCFGNIQSRYRSLEWSQGYQPHAKRNRCLQKGCEYKDRSIQVLSKGCEYKERTCEMYNEIHNCR